MAENLILGRQYRTSPRCTSDVKFDTTHEAAKYQNHYGFLTHAFLQSIRASYTIISRDRKTRHSGHFLIAPDRRLSRLSVYGPKPAGTRSARLGSAFSNTT